MSGQSSKKLVYTSAQSREGQASGKRLQSACKFRRCPMPPPLEVLETQQASFTASDRAGIWEGLHWPLVLCLRERDAQALSAWTRSGLK